CPITADFTSDVPFSCELVENLMKPVGLFLRVPETVIIHLGSGNACIIEKLVYIDIIPVILDIL
ncbi:MAG TPA: hypothetical protein PKI80_06280, partial [Deltaproteobacteria bacterium]|nr:hypothetical protein [Deltaproteobacteria bacterium]